MLISNRKKSGLKSKNSVAIREERAKEAFICLGVSGHELFKGIALDLGCGPGYITNYFIKKGVNTLGLDVNKRILSKAKFENPSADFVLASGIKLPLRKNIFHTVILNDVLEHVSYQDGKYILEQIRKILWSEGRLYISVANKYQVREPHTLLYFITWLPRKIYNPLICKLYHRNPIYPYTIKRLKKLCREIGFIYENFTWFYARRKIHNLNYIRDLKTKRFVIFLKDIKLLDNILLTIAEKFSVILFVCK